MTLVLYYIFLVFFSILIWRNAYSAWKLDGSFTIPIVTFFMFYFTLGGAFIFPIDAFFNFKGTEIGLHYLPIFDRLFLVSFDYDYILSIFYYIIFILVFQYTYLFSIKKIATKFESVKTTQTINNEQEASSFKFVVNPWIVLAISFLLIGVSATILWDEIYYAIANEKSIYSTTRATLSKYYTLHQLANEFSVLIPFLAFSFAITKSNKFNVQAITKKSTLFIILFACVVSASYIVLLGNRREVLSGLVVCALIAVNNYKNVYFKRFFLISFLTLSLFLANDFFRSTYIPIQLNSVLKFDKQRKIPKLAPTQIVNQNPVDSLGQKTPLKLKIKKQSNKSYIAARSKQVISSFVFSNELFYAHFSLYGCIHKDIPLTYGSSFVNLLTSIVPRSIYPNRPIDVYNYYAKAVKSKIGQIYTIHHAAAWYLNFGFLGIVIGGIVLSLLFVFAFYLGKLSIKSSNTFLMLLKFLLPYLLCAQIVTFITAGPEAYKAMLLEGIIIPIVLLLLCFKKSSILK